MTSLFVELPWSRKVLGQADSGAAEKATTDRCGADGQASAESLFKFRREDGLPHAL